MRDMFFNKLKKQVQLSLLSLTVSPYHLKIMLTFGSVRFYLNQFREATVEVRPEQIQRV
jgi:hypothetical protein